jgi:serine/threonine protein kinase
MDNNGTRKFGRYEIVGELGRGAMGIVYKARDPQIDRLVALKTVSLRGQDPDEEKEFLQRFVNEAQAAGRLHHSGIVAIFDVGEDSETHDQYIVLEYVPGEALNKILAREKTLPLDKALVFAEEIADALDYAHEQGVVHRDIKPGNILVTETGHVKIADFGIAKLNLAQMTIPGRVLGTPAFMAPEQLSGEGVDGRSDLFSLGVILYAMVTGHSPFQGNSATTVCFKVANREPVHASALNLNLPRELDAVITRAMAKDPAERYQRGAELANDLRQLRQDFPNKSTTSSLPAVMRTATSSRGFKPSAPPQKAMAQASQALLASIRKVRVRDLILGAATLAMLVTVGLQSKKPAILSKVPAAAPDVLPSGLIVPNAIPSVANAPAANSQASGSMSTAAAVSPAADSPSRPTVSHKRATRKAEAKKSSAVAEARTAVPIAPEVKPVIVVPLSTVQLAVQHQFKDATLTVWVDDQLTLTRPLHGGVQKRLVVFNGVRGMESETMKIPAGKHTLRVRTQTADQTVDLSRTVSADLAGGDDKTLQVTFEKHNTAMRLTWQ